MTSINELLQEIINGDMDGVEKQIIEAFRLRAKNKNAPRLDQIKPGMRVRLVNCPQSPLEGSVGTVTEVANKLVMVKLDKPPGDQSKKIFSCPTGLLKLIK